MAGRQTLAMADNRPGDPGRMPGAKLDLGIAQLHPFKTSASYLAHCREAFGASAWLTGAMTVLVCAVAIMWLQCVTRMQTHYSLTVKTAGTAPLLFHDVLVSIAA